MPKLPVAGETYGYALATGLVGSILTPHCLIKKEGD